MLDGAKILRETWGNNTLTPLYDNEDSVCGIIYNNAPYYFQKNLQGDIIGIVDKDSTVVARYSYDAWGVPTIAQDSTDCAIATINPFRYRSYYFDREIGMYYLQSRYYDPEVGRFINGDEILGSNDDHAAYALYTYCANLPVDRCDCFGFLWKKIRNGVKNTVRKFLNKTNKKLISWGIDTAAIGAYWLNMYKDASGIYHAKFNCWQQYFGYNDFYDFMFYLGTSMDSEKFPFVSKQKKYILWAWKGNYINLGAGAEIGIYYGGGPHWKVDKKLATKMSMDLKYRNKKIISYSKKTWWLTGFNPNRKYLDAQAHELRVTFTVWLKGDFFNDFCKTCKNTNFKKNNKNKTITISF